MFRLCYEMDLPTPRDRVWEACTRGGTLPCAGEVLFEDRPRLLHLGESDESSSVTVRLFPTLDGTRLEVIHEVACDLSTRDRLDRRWQAALESLRIALRRA